MYKVLLAFFLIAGTFAKEVPTLRSAVHDHAEMMSPEVRGGIRKLLQRPSTIEKIQMAILTVESLEDETLEGYSIKVADQWKLGSEQSDQGLLFLVSKKDRKMRFEVGQGLEGVIPDAYAKRIINHVSAFFKRGDYDQGFLFATASALKYAGVVVNLPKGSEQRYHKDKKRKNPYFTLLFIIFLIYLFIRHPRLAFLILLSSGRGGGRSSGSFGGGGGFSGGGGGFSGGGASGGW